MNLPNNFFVQNAYRLLYLIRKVEERLIDIYHTDKIKSPIHLSIGQEAVSVGVCMALKETDVVFGTYRSHALYIAKGGDLKKMIAELYGKSTGCCKGKGGSMHLADKTAGMMGTSAIVSSSIPNALGYALALKMKGHDTVVPVFFGDGATEEGVYYESLNFAALRKLPVLFVCENNKYAIHTSWEKRVTSQNYCERAKVFGVPSHHVTGNNFIEIYEAAKCLINEARNNGPRFLEVETYRWREHVGPNEDWDLGYRSNDEIQPWVDGDQLLKIGALLSDPSRRLIEDLCEKEIEEAFQFAEESPFPKQEDLYKHVFQ